MVLKKSVIEKGWLLVDREPSLHSWTAIVWEALAATMLFTGYAYRGSKPSWCSSVAWNPVRADTASLRTTFAPVHRLFGQLSLTVVVGMAYLGLTEKNEIWERQLLGYLIVGIGSCSSLT